MGANMIFDFGIYCAVQRGIFMKINKNPCEGKWHRHDTKCEWSRLSLSHLLSHDENLLRQRYREEMFSFMRKVCYTQNDGGYKFQCN